MPQHHRSVAFSTKKKKEQLKVKREKKKFIPTNNDGNRQLPLYEEQKSRPSSTSFHYNKTPFSSKMSVESRNTNSETLPSNSFMDEVEEIGSTACSRNRKYNLKFKKSEKDKIKSQVHYKPIIQVSEEEAEVDSDKFFPPGLDYPKRPPWTKNMSKASLDQTENKSFRLFCESIDKAFASDELSLYELNLETWRQLWRVTEMSDILLIIVDVRYAVAQFPPYLYKHLVEKENKGVIVILNKCDLLPASLVLAWQDYFITRFPKLTVLPFSSLEGKELKKSTRKVAIHSSLRLIEACKKLVEGHVDLRSWLKKVEEESVDNSATSCEVLQQHECESTAPEEHHQYKNGVLTIGTIGHPNVGKSSLINALMGKKVVSVSKTPGHTKYFQTIFITKNVKLCDCPGLVFPSLCDKLLQVVIGSYPVAQVRDPISVIEYIASRLDIPALLKLAPENEADSTEEFYWTPFYICEAWAKKRGYFTKTKGGKPDVFRAANELLRYTLVGFKSLVLSLKPPGYLTEREKYEADPRLDDIHQIQGFAAKVSKEAEDFEPPENAKGRVITGTHCLSNREGFSENASETSDEENAFLSCESSNEDTNSCDVEQNKFSLLTIED